MDSQIITQVRELCAKDGNALRECERQYGDSWKQRGGVGAFMMLARKWDRLEKAVHKDQYDIFKTISADQRPEGILDDIRDLRRYLLLVEAEMANRGVSTAQAGSASGMGISGLVEITKPSLGVVHDDDFNTEAANQ